jgi:hypothetical protein
MTLHALQDVTSSAYAQDIVFEDPISRFTDLGGYQFMIRALKTLFSVTFDLHDVTVTAPDMVTTRWAEAGRQAGNTHLQWQLVAAAYSSQPPIQPPTLQGIACYAGQLFYLCLHVVLCVCVQVDYGP